ncbi:hypothetical protein [Palleronia sp.]|uniref:hypothetical protein n=1 Tax=Palleronia sp. TaxID=1940284 RepID=UPI0035C8309C
MKTFLTAAAFFAVSLVVSGFVYEQIEYTATEAYSRDTARVGHDNPVDGRLGWSPDLEEE